MPAADAVHCRPSRGYPADRLANCTFTLDGESHPAITQDPDVDLRPVRFRISFQYLNDLLNRGEGRLPWLGRFAVELLLPGMKMSPPRIICMWSIGMVSIGRPPD